MLPKKAPVRSQGAIPNENKSTMRSSRALSVPLVVFCVIVTAAAILLGQQSGIRKALLRFTLRFSGLKQVSVLRLLAEGEMDWERSTTPIPISSVSHVAKCMLGGNWEQVPKGLHWMKGMDTILVRHVREWFFKERLRKVKKFCEEENRFCVWDEQDSTYGLTPLHLAMYGGDDELEEFLTKNIGLKDDMSDKYGRFGKNVSFRSFPANARKFARLRGGDCEIPEVVIDGTQKAWDEVKRLVSEGEPIMLRNAVAYLDKEFLDNWNIDAFLNEFGDANVRVGSVPYSKVFGIKEDSMKLLEFWKRYGGHNSRKKDPLYVFQHNVAVCAKGWQILKKLIRLSFPTPDLIEDPDKAGEDSIQFFFGMTGSGAPLHIHADAVNLVVSGEKRWYIQTPRKTMYSRKPVKEWVEQDVKDYDEADRPLECTQRAGDIAYVPMDWGHAILNMKDNTFGYAIEVLNKRDTFSHLAPRS